MNDRDQGLLPMLLGAGGCLLFLAYGAVSVWALFDLVHHYWGFNLFASLAVVVLVAMFVPGLAGIGPYWVHGSLGSGHLSAQWRSACPRSWLASRSCLVAGSSQY